MARDRVLVEKRQKVGTAARPAFPQRTGTRTPGLRSRTSSNANFRKT